MATTHAGGFTLSFAADQSDYDNAAGEVVEYTVRVPCKACGRRYVWPKGSSAPNGIGPCCQPTLDDAISGEVMPHEPVPATVQHMTVAAPEEPSQAPPALPGHALSDVLCVMRCMRLADGWTSDGFNEPGLALCLGCAVQLADREAALDEDPWLPLPEFDPLMPDAVGRL